MFGVCVLYLVCDQMTGILIWKTVKRFSTWDSSIKVNPQVEQTAEVWIPVKVDEPHLFSTCPTLQSFPVFDTGCRLSCLHILYHGWAWISKKLLKNIPSLYFSKTVFNSSFIFPRMDKSSHFSDVVSFLKLCCTKSWK